MKHEFQSSILCNESEFPTYPRPSVAPNRSVVKRNLNWSFVDGGSLTNTVKVSVQPKADSQTNCARFLGDCRLKHKIVQVIINSLIDNLRILFSSIVFSALWFRHTKKHTSKAVVEFFRPVIKWCANFALPQPASFGRSLWPMEFVLFRSAVFSVFTVSAVILSVNPDSNLFPRCIYIPLFRLNGSAALACRLDGATMPHHGTNSTEPMKRHGKWMWISRVGRKNGTIDFKCSINTVHVPLDIQYITSVSIDCLLYGFSLWADRLEKPLQAQYTHFPPPPTLFSATHTYTWLANIIPHLRLHKQTPPGYKWREVHNIHSENFYYSNNSVPMICAVPSQ